jgi:sporulation protein YlmC with PRC-barrel domain
MATTEETTRSLVGRPVVDIDGEDLGHLEEVYRDWQSDRLTWGVVSGGRFGRRRFVPLRQAIESGEEIRVHATKAEVRDGPDVEAGDALNPAAESALDRHFGMAGPAGADEGRRSAAGSWLGHTVVDRGGDRIGRVDHVYRDAQTDEPTWAVVSRGFPRQQHFVPLSGVSNEGHQTLRIAATKDQVYDAPDVEEPRSRLARRVEERLKRHYARVPDARQDAAQPAPAPPPVAAVPRLDPDREAPEEAPEARRRAAASPVREQREQMREARARQHDEYGGFKWGAAFFGWLIAFGIAVLLTAVLSAAGAALGLTDVDPSQATSAAGTIGVVGGTILVLILVIAYFAGGYVAGRLARFDGARQGLGTWLLGLLITILAGVAGLVFGSQYNILASLNLPRVPVDEGSITTGAFIALGAVIVGTLVVAIVGGKTGERFHKKIDQVGT